MSLAISIAKSSARGDPGFFGSLLKGIGGAVSGFVTGGPLGAITGAYKGVTSGGGSTRSQIALANAPVGVSTGGKPLMAPVSLAGFSLANAVAPSPGPGSSLIHHPIERLMNEAVFTDQPPPGGGYHANKGRYWSEKLGRAVQPGELWVKNRRRNPLNPRAASRAIRRLKSAHKATRAINRFFGK